MVPPAIFRAGHTKMEGIQLGSSKPALGRFFFLFQKGSQMGLPSFFTANSPLHKAPLTLSETIKLLQLSDFLSHWSGWTIVVVVV